MAITIVLDRANTGVDTRAVGSLAAALGRSEPMRLIVRDAGPLLGWLNERVGSGRIMVCNRGIFPFDADFADRVKAAIALLAGDPADLVYVCGVGASDFAVAAHLDGRRAILQVREGPAEVEDLFERDQVKREAISHCEALVLANGRNRREAVRMFGNLPFRMIELGCVIDAKTARHLAEGDPAIARNAAGRTLEWNGRLVVGMCGEASADTGSDIFLEIAGQCPEFDFVWIGGWSAAEAPGNVAHDTFVSRTLENLYVTGRVTRPHPSIAKLAVYCHSARAPRVISTLIEAAALDIPIIGFSRPGPAELLGRIGILCHGEPTAADAAHILRTVNAEHSECRALLPAPAQLEARFGIVAYIESIQGLIADVRRNARSKADSTARNLSA